jgi:methionyl-tRNA formyltransferase
MNITLLGHKDIASLYAVNQIVRGAPQHRFSVFFGDCVIHSTRTPAALRQLAVADHKLCQRFLQCEQVSSLLVEAPYLTKPNTRDGLLELSAMNPDLIVSIRYRQILKSAAIAIPQQGVLNLHSGVLPDYRGVMATFWAMLAGEKETGTTLHRIVDAGIDTGPVLSIQRQALRPDWSYLANVLSLYDAGCAAMLAAMATIESGIEPASSIQPANTGAYFSAPEVTDLNRFHAQGLRLVADDDFEHLNLCHNH